MVDTETCSYDSWRIVLAEHGCELPMDQYEARVGSTEPTRWHPLDALEAYLGGPVDRDSLTAYRDSLRSIILPTLMLEPGALDLLDRLRAKGIPIGIVSSSEWTWVTGHLDRLGVRHYFETICCREDVPRTKSDPALYFLAMTRLGVTAADAIAVEDSPNGARAALAAGLRTLVVPNAITTRYAFPEGVERFTSLIELGEVLDV